MSEPIIIDTQLYPDEAYEPLRKTLKNMFESPDVLIHFAKAIKRECEAHELCVDCPLHQFYKGCSYPTCPFMCAANPMEWTLEKRGEEVKK